MDKILNGHFFNPSKGKLKIPAMIKEIIRYISEKPERFYDIVVGCDSSSSEEPHFPLAVVVLRTGEGGRFFLKKINYKDRKFYSYKTRILEEVFLSCQLASYLRENFDKEALKVENKNLHFQFRYIHADVGENGKTKDMIKEVVGLIKGNGFEPKIKPESYAASCVADRFS
ncbi:MAG: ribonuclease H-like YkuK family protein [Candidatus Pacebacteria bacterium]|nr:ribonuclease H-like YkuK family protein [Candidatus Paceibacterota bacterium]